MIVHPITAHGTPLESVRVGEEVDDSQAPAAPFGLVGGARRVAAIDFLLRRRLTTYTWSHSAVQYDVPTHYHLGFVAQAIRDGERLRRRKEMVRDTRSMAEPVAMRTPDHIRSTITIRAEQLQAPTASWTSTPSFT